ncbi:RDD family protein [Chryseobacterium sp. KMC2]|uniref:RDD family protein n=1 Tax=Chryseobacterium sp. KMC2 TaxID=2800705 RepID=UPI0019240AE0|nr:RDD family protein [Chryseobacterium sp. KMC2]MBL3550178.1 RDD family protein [Chryseobacterium sp. KMC2]
MRVSELKVHRIIRRPSKIVDKYGNRIFEEYEYDFKYNPYFKNSETQRLFAKIIDILPFILILIFLCNLTVLQSLLWSVVLVMMYGAISETIFGKTLGKKIFNLMVIDDFAHKPSLSRSLKRNILCLINFFPTFTDQQNKTVMNFNMYLNNKFAGTYIIKEKMLKEIEEMLEKQA